MAFRDQIFFRTFEKRAPGRERLEDVEKSEIFPQTFQLKMAGLKLCVLQHDPRPPLTLNQLT